MTVSVDKLLKTFIKIRNKRSELSAEFKEADDKLSKQQDKIKFAMLDYCKEQGVDSVKTADGVFYRTIRKRFGQVIGSLCTSLCYNTRFLSFSKNV